MNKNNKCYYRRFWIKQNIIHIELEAVIPPNADAWIVLSYQHEWDDSKIQIPVNKVVKKKTTLLKCDINLEEYSLKMVEWKIALKVVVGTTSYDMTCMVDKPLLRKQFYIRDKALKYVSGEGDIYFLFLVCDYQVLIVHRDHCIYDDAPYRGREVLAKLCFLFSKRYWKKQNIWLFFEKESQTAQDNGWYFYKYCLEKQIFKKCNARAYFVSKNNNAELGCVEFYSLRHMMYLQAATLLISSESREQAVVWRNRNSFLRDCLDEKKLFFLQHGVIGLKKLPHFHYKNGGKCDVFIASSETEKQYIIKELGYKEEQVKVTGLARYDLLTDTRDQQQKKFFLVMPTWRTWLDDVSVETFCESVFYKEYNLLLHNEALIEFLENHQIDLIFCLHPKAQKYQDNFKNIHPAIKIIFYKNEDLQCYIKGCSFLITDYSSIAWDVYYLEKPVVFFQFDLTEYLEKCGSYLELHKGEVFGTQVKEQSDLLLEIQRLSKQDFCMDEIHLQEKNKWFAFHDQDNCGRICKELLTYVDKEL